MNFAWHLPRTMRIDAAAARLPLGHTERVLLAYDGPQLTVVRDGWRTFLDYAADDDGDDIVRWIRAEVSSVELKALHRGKISLRDAVAKSEVTVFDKGPRGAIVDSWKVAKVSLPEGCLPGVGAELPAFARDPHGSPFHRPGTWLRLDKPRLYGAAVLTPPSVWATARWGFHRRSGSDSE